MNMRILWENSLTRIKPPGTGARCVRNDEHDLFNAEVQGMFVHTRNLRSGMVLDAGEIVQW